MDKILIISAMEYGTLIDQVEWCRYLSEKYEVTHFSQSNKNLELNLKNLFVRKIKRKNNILLRKLEFIMKSRKQIKCFNPDLVIMDYFPGCCFIKIFINKKMIVDIRTTTISNSELKKYIRDKLIKFESLFFDKITIISKSIIKKLELDSERCYELPLGATCVVDKKNNSKNIDKKIRMLYVGTFNERHIDKTIYAIKVLIEKRPDIDIYYTIIGYSNNEKYDQYLKKLIKQHKLDRYIIIKGKVDHNKLKKYYELNNVGISFIPMKDHFDLQPPTKTYEYIINGLFCLATNTTANRSLINYKNGLIINDDIRSIANGIEEIYDNLDKISCFEISSTLEDCTWDKIVNNKLVPLINDIIRSK